MEIISIYGHNSIILFPQLKELGTSTFQVNGCSQVRLRVAAIPSPSRVLEISDSSRTRVESMPFLGGSVTAPSDLSLPGLYKCHDSINLCNAMIIFPPLPSWHLVL